MKILGKYVVRGLVFFGFMMLINGIFHLNLNAIAALAGTAVYLLFSFACDKILDVAAKRRG